MRAALLVLAGLALASPLAAAPAAAADPADAVRIGRYRLERTGDALAIASPGDARVGRALAVGGAVLLVAGVALATSGRRGLAIALALLGLGLAVAGALGAFGSTRVRASRTELVREGFGARTQRWPRDALATVEVVRRAPSAEDRKRVGLPRWDVRVRARSGERLAVRFTLGSEGEARALATALANALDLPPPER